MKLETNMYVRTKDGIIAKCTEIRINRYMFDKIILENGYYNDWEFIDIPKEKSLIKKASHNIIELIEQQDLLFIDISPDDCGGIVVPRIAETLAELEEYKERIKSGECILKGVLTREQIQANIYKLDDSHA